MKTQGGYSNMELSERLKQARKQNNYTQQEVADILNISRTTISSWEVGRTIPSINYIIDLSNIYNISLDILLKEDISVRKQINKEEKTKKIYKKISIITLIVLSIFILINSIWWIKTTNDYKEVTKHFDKTQYGYNLEKNKINYSIGKPKYLSFSNDKQLEAVSQNNGHKWIFSKNENYGKIYVKFSNGGESSLIINSELVFDEKANQDIGLTFSKEEQKDIDTYLNKNKPSLQKFYDNSYALWKKI